jgi:two-component system cell cycle sensor histidine kinase/response regulator CckA
MKFKFLTFSIPSAEIYVDNTVRSEVILRIILSYCFFAIAGMCAIALISNWPVTAMLTGVMTVLILLIFVPLNRGWYRFASWLLLLTLLLGSVYSAYNGDGLHDIGMVGVPGILVIAALLLDRRFFITFAGLSITIPFFITFLKILNNLAIWHPDQIWVESLILSMILGVISVGVRILIDHFLNSFSRLLDSENRYKNFYTNIQDIYYEIDMNGRILEISQRAEELMGYAVRDLIGRSIQDFYVLPLNHKIFMEDITGGRRLDNYEVQFRDSHENLKVVSINASLVTGEEGKPEKIVGSMRDISEKKHLEQQLFQAQKLESVGTLAGGIAHDFNNLLTVINGHCELALRNLGERDPITASDVKAIKSAGERAANLTRQLLMFSKKQVTSPAVINPNTVIRNMEKMFNRLLGEDIDIHYELDEEIACILSDPIQFEQILLNLMINARDSFSQRDHEKAEKQIFIGTGMVANKKSDRKVQITIRDTGSGMDRAVQERIFEPFFTTKEQGTGLGLSTVYGIIKQNNAAISVSSEQGKGSTFTILWPECRSISKGVEDIPDDKRFKGTGHILLVEDDPSVRLFTAQALRHNGYSVMETSDGATALEYFMSSRKDIDLLVTDMILPGISGLDLYHTLKEKDGDLKVLFISGYASTEILNKLQPEEKENFLHKPFGITDLMHHVRRVLENNRMVKL